MVNDKLTTTAWYMSEGNECVRLRRISRSSRYKLFLLTLVYQSEPWSCIFEIFEFRKNILHSNQFPDVRSLFNLTKYLVVPSSYHFRYNTHRPRVSLVDMLTSNPTNSWTNACSCLSALLACICLAMARLIHRNMDSLLGRAASSSYYGTPHRYCWRSQGMGWRRVRARSHL